MSVLAHAKIRVSSVFADDTKTFGRQNLTDKNDETCWQSAQGIGQFIRCKFEAPTAIRRFEIQFQGGFAARQIDVRRRGLPGEPTWVTLASIYPADTNERQSFTLAPDEMAEAEEFSFDLVSASDFFGRFVVYHFDCF